MSPYNLFKMVHNVWFQQLIKKAAWLYVVTFDDYVRTFKQNTLYQVYSVFEWWSIRKVPNRNEFCLHKVSKFRKPLLLAIIITKYALGSSYASRMLHLEGEEVFKCCK